VDNVERLRRAYERFNATGKFDGKVVRHDSFTERAEALLVAGL
jgi:hypothetical protein